ncbi:hypothetical protein QBC47DRAFT_434849 [Echria macrotheca]|uniref:BTB domain-containing protein n=1 Tax=Echria macrotheca TaxID=438768 RepID=A0AAJ0F1D4_9PEZI|nr:hypothetical protein QBC47DRAFT_434849 [Echria macrotheca]
MASISEFRHSIEMGSQCYHRYVCHPNGDTGLVLPHASKVFLVRAAFLESCSTIFRTQLAKARRLKNTKDDGDEERLMLTDNESDAKAMRIVMNILNGNRDQVPKELGLNRFTKVAVIVDRWQIGSPKVAYFARQWGNLLHRRLTLSPFGCDLFKKYMEPQRELVLLLYASWVFKSPSLFKEATGRLVDSTHGFLRVPKELRIPQAVIDAVHRKKQEIFGRIMRLIDERLDDLFEHEVGCHCRLKQIGVLVDRKKYLSCNDMASGNYVSGIIDWLRFPCPWDEEAGCKCEDDDKMASFFWRETGKFEKWVDLTYFLPYAM